MTWNTKGDLPYCYSMPKEKDINKMRPIVSYANHPLKRQFNKIGKVLLFMLKESKIESLTLWKIDDVEELKKVNEIVKEWKKKEEIGRLFRIQIETMEPQEIF